MKYTAGILLVVLSMLSLSQCETPAPKPIPHRGPHRPLFPPRKPAKCTKKPIVVAVIDTGFGAGWEGEQTAHLCKYGHVDFVNDAVMPIEYGKPTKVPKDENGHGTHIAGIIDSYAKAGHADYCLVILKYYDPKNEEANNIFNTIAAINYARQIHADFINYSGGGGKIQLSEQEAVKKFIDGGGTFVAAAGNEASDLAVHPYYPAMEDDRVVVVGSTYTDGKHSKISNFGDRIDRWEIGTNVKMYDHYMTGTSQATAIATGKLVAQKKNTCN